MEQRIFIMITALMVVLHMGISFASTKINLEYYEEAARSQTYHNACLIRSYNQKVLIGYTTGTLCQKDKRKFILTAQYVRGGTRHVAHFGNGLKYEIQDFSVLTDFRGQNTKEQKSISSARATARAELAIGFLSMYPENIEPARLVSLRTSVIGLAHRTMPENHEIILLWNLMQIRNRECHLVGFGYPISPLSHPDLLLSYHNGTLKRTMVTGRIGCEISKEEKEGGHLFSTTFMGCGNCNATQSERPITRGFIGGSLRDENDEIVAVASHVDDFKMMEEFRQSHPWHSGLFNCLKRVTDFSSAKVFCEVKVSHLALAGVGVYACFNPSELGAIAGMGFWAVTLNLIEPLYARLTQNLYPLGTKSYYIPVLPLMEKIDAYLDACADSSTENTSEIEHL